MKPPEQGQEGAVTAELLQGTPAPHPFTAPSIVWTLALCMATEWPMLGLGWPSTGRSEGHMLTLSPPQGHKVTEKKDPDV